MEVEMMSAVHDSHIQTLDINHLEKIRLLESKIEEVHQVRVAVQGPAESEEGGSGAFGVCQGGDDDVQE